MEQKDAFEEVCGYTVALVTDFKKTSLWLIERYVFCEVPVDNDGWECRCIDDFSFTDSLLFAFDDSSHGVFEELKDYML